MSVEEVDHMLSMYIEKGYRHLRLHPLMRDWLIFRYNGRYYQCVALPFEWGRSPLWFTRLMSPFVARLRSHGYRLLLYIDDFLIIPTSYGIVSRPSDCQKARVDVELLMKSLGLSRNEKKGEWEGSQVVDNLGVRVDTVGMRFLVVPHKAKQVRDMAATILKQV